ncbi:hypothetical protein ILUMI_17702 [Ignelater luminosus]|uniref:Peptidase M14 domain-containing protein n=1 Tax=Ignelater luminosus TaxID=2038154 RepID=A0A8K0CMT2_IGNLU|nr:hypothetical protein ILUMI_17702 [Ignelater luminosus]
MNFYILLLFLILKQSKSNGYHALYDTKIAEAAVDKHDWQILWQERDENGLDILSFHKEAPGIWLVTFRARPISLRNLRRYDIKYRIIVNNMRRHIEFLLEEIKEGPPSIEMGNATFLNYLNFDEVVEYVESTPRFSTPYKLISTEVIGRSVQNRSIPMLRIDNAGVNDTIVVEAGMHGREWISVMTAVYLIAKLVREGDDFPELGRLNWFIIPCLNPDGYYHSLQIEGYTFHRKNLNVEYCPPKQYNCSIESCGVDLNRNFAFHDIKVGIHGNPCVGTYGGRRSFSEPESQALQSILKLYKDRIKMFISLHSYGPFILYPWSYKKEKCNDWKDLVRAARKAVKAIQSVTFNATHYKIKNIGTEFGPTAGCVEDYAKHLGIKYSYRMELQRAGNRVFMPKLENIKNFCKENFYGIAALAMHISKQPEKLGMMKGKAKDVKEVKSSQDFVKPNILYIMFLYGALLN